jgi:hypothetical protein
LAADCRSGFAAQMSADLYIFLLEERANGGRRRPG